MRATPPTLTATSPSIVVHEIETLDLRRVFPREDYDFTPWLGRPENLARLARSLGRELELLALEAGTGNFRTDILARDLNDGTIVVIENQFGRSDHDHLGKALTYLAAHEAKTIIWVAETFADEHRATLAWLNDHTPEDIGLYAVTPRLMSIAGSPPGLQFEIVVGPNQFVKVNKPVDPIDPSIISTRAEFWPVFMERVRAGPVLAACTQRYGGRLGFLWLLPSVAAEWVEDEPHVLIYLNAPSRGRQGIGVAVYGRSRTAVGHETAERLEQVRARLEVRGILGPTPTDLANENGRRQAAALLVTRAKEAVEDLRQAFA